MSIICNRFRWEKGKICFLLQTYRFTKNTFQKQSYIYSKADLKVCRNTANFYAIKLTSKFNSPKLCNKQTQKQNKNNWNGTNFTNYTNKSQQSSSNEPCELKRKTDRWTKNRHFLDKFYLPQTLLRKNGRNEKVCIH